MALAFNQRVISSKIEILAEQRNHLHTLIQEVDEVLRQAKSWLRNADETNNANFKDIYKMIEDKFLFLSDKFTDCSEGCEKIAGQQESATTRSSSVVSTSIDQPLPVRYSQALVVPDELKTIMSQVKVMQDAMSFLSTNTEKISEKQSIMEQSLENLSDKYSKEQQEKLKEIKNELKNNYEKQKRTTAKQDKRMKSLENKIQAVTDAQSENHQQQKTMMKEQKKENERQLQQFTHDLNIVLENVQELNGRICLQENNLTFLKPDSKSLTEKFEEHVSLSEEFTRKTEETLTNLSSVQGREFERLQKFEEKVDALKMSWDDISQETEKRYKDVENKYQMVCQVVADRLAPLERLKVIFNEKLDVRKEAMEKLDNVYDQMADLLPKFSQLEAENQRRTVGFFTCVTCCPNTSGAVKGFTDIFNIGNHFNPRTGVFTAPVQGLYATFLSVRGTENGMLKIAIKKNPCMCLHNFDWCDDCNVGEILMNISDKRGYVFVVVDMNAGETLFTRSLLEECAEKCCITFASIKIG